MKTLPFGARSLDEAVRASRAQIARAQALLNHPGHPDQKSHGRKGGAGTGGDFRDEEQALAEQGATLLRRDDLTDGEHQLTAYSSMREEYREEVATRVAERWDVSREDLDAAIAEDNATKYYEGKSLEEAKRDYIYGQMQSWEGSAGKPPTAAIIHAVASQRSSGLTLSDREQGVVDYVAARPAVARALSGLGHAMYSSTQDYFAERGITSVALHRHTSSPGVESGNLYTSWSVPGSNFHQADYSMTRVDAAIPVGRIFSIPSTGFGSLPEGEVVVMPA